MGGDARRRAGRALRRAVAVTGGRACSSSGAVHGRGQPRLPRGARRARRAASTSAARDVHARALRRSRRTRAARRRRAAPGASRTRDPPPAARLVDALIPPLRPTPGRSACSTARTARPTSSRPRTSTTFFATAWKVHYNSDRTGVRLIGPQARLGAHRRRRGRAAPVQHPRQRLRDRHRRLHRRHADHPRPRRPEPRRLRLSRHHRRGRALEDGPAQGRRHASASCRSTARRGAQRLAEAQRCRDRYACAGGARRPRAPR